MQALGTVENEIGFQHFLDRFMPTLQSDASPVQMAEQE
jgi:hypothetical protein